MSTRMTDDEVKAIAAERCSARELGDLRRSSSVEVRSGQDHDGEPSLFVTAAIRARDIPFWRVSDFRTRP